VSCFVVEVQLLRGARLDRIEIVGSVREYVDSRNPRETTTRQRRGQQYRSASEPVPPGPIMFEERTRRANERLTV
jgi:hypothetical protein